MSGYCFPISWKGSHFYRDCCQHLKQQPVYLAISCNVARWEWEGPGRERKHQGQTWRRSRVETTNFPQEDSDAHTSMNAWIQNVYAHRDICTQTCIQPHTHTHHLFWSWIKSQGSSGLELVAANPVLTSVLSCISCLMRRCQSHQLIYHRTTTHWHL